MARGDFAIVDTKPIGRGYSGTVFRATRRCDGRNVALKLVLHNEEGGAERIAAERHGAILQQRFGEKHGMVPEIFDYGNDGDDFYIAMELVDGPSLEVRLRTGPLAPADAAGHAIWLCDFLEKAHGFSSTVEGKPYRLLHNDLKPAHLMIPASGERKVLDFGISKALEETRDLGTDVGRTIAYAAPERLLSGHVNVHADFWSIGVMLYEMVSGHRPYPSLDGRRFRAQLEHAIVTHAPRMPLPDDCPPHLAGIINRLLAFQPEHRYQTPAAIREDLERFQRGDTPLAAAYYDTPATTPVARLSSASGPPTAAATAPRVVVPTDPVPRAATPAARPAVRLAAAPAATAVLAPRTVLPRAALALVSLMLVAVVATEGVAWIVAERFRDGVATLDERNVTASREAYAGVDRWSVLDLGLRARVHGELRRRLRLVADRVIEDYRRESPAMGPAEWRQAQEALAWARELSPFDRSLRAKQLVAEAHLERVAAQKANGTSAATLAAERAMAKFREAATADERSYDPYLAMAVIQVYYLADLDGAAASIDEAVKRGYTRTRREKALLGDGYLRRALSARARAGVLTGDLRRSELLKARDDFERCVGWFEQIVEFGRAAQNLERCRAQIPPIDRLLDAHHDE
jgi:hypothetical protein